MLASAVFGESETEQQVLVLHSYHAGYPWTQALTEGIRTGFRKERLKNVRLSFEHLALRRHPEPEYSVSLQQYLQQKYKNEIFDAIIICDDPALGFVRSALPGAWYGKFPLVFCGINETSLDFNSLPQNMTGIHELDESEDLLKTMLHLFPETEHLYVLSDRQNQTAHLPVRQIKEAAAELDPELDVRIAGKLSAGELKQELQRLPENTVILLTCFFQDKTGQRFAPEDTCALINSSTRLPVFTFWGDIYKHGILGGKTSNGEKKGQLAAALAARIIRGEAPAAITPPEQPATNYIFNWLELKRFGIKLSDLPPGSALINEPISFLRKNRTWIIAGLIIILTQALIMIRITIISRERKRAIRQVRENEQHLHSIISHMPVMVMAFDTRGKLIFWNEECTRVLGYEADEMKDRPYREICEKICPASDPCEDMLSENQNTSAISRNIERELRAKDGSLKTILWSDLSGRFPIPGWSSWSVGLDISRRRRAAEELQRKENQLRLVIEGIRLGFWSRDLKSGEYTVDRNWLDMLGYERDELPEKFDELMIRLIHPDDVGTLNESVTAHLTGKRMFQSAEIRFRHKNGNWIWTQQMGLSVSCDESGTPLRMLGILQNITPRKKAETELRHDHQLLEALIENIPIGLWAKSVDPGNPYFIWNNAMEKLSGIPAAEAIGKSTRQIMDTKISAEIEKSETRVLKTGKAELPHELEFLGRDGNRRRLRMVTMPLFNEQKALCDLLGLVEDITDQRKMEENLRQTQKMEAIGRLAGGIAHDFNNLLQIILGYSELLRNTLPKELLDGNELNEIIGAGERAMVLVRRLLAFSRKEKMQLEKVNLNEITIQFLKMLKRLIGEHIRIEFQPSVDLDPVMADARQLEQILMNLCVNARDAMPDGGVITIKTENILIDTEFCHLHSWAEPGRYIRLSVEDTGIGIPSENQSRVFEPFFTTKACGDGTGLGLATVYGIIENHGGTIQLYSEDGIGTSFQIYLPAVEETDEETIRTAESTVPAGRGETVLLAEDDKGVRRLTGDILRGSGYNVLEAENGRKALELFASDHAAIDLLLLDVVMPEMDGVRLYDEIRRLGHEHPVLFCSGYSQRQLFNEHPEAAREPIIQKPYQPRELLRILREMLDNRA